MNIIKQNWALSLVITTGLILVCWNLRATYAIKGDIYELKTDLAVLSQIVKSGKEAREKFQASNDDKHVNTDRACKELEKQIQELKLKLAQFESKKP